MSVKNFIYYTPIIISILGIISIVLAIKNKDKKNNKYIIVGDIIFMIYMFIISALLHNNLPIIVDFGIIIIWFISIIGGILYLISIIICLIKRKKLNNITENKKTFKLFLTIVLIPIILFVIVLLKEMYLINNSTILLSYNSKGNGGILEYKDLVYAISDKYFKEISIDVTSSYDYYEKIFLPRNLKKINENKLQNLGYKIIIDNNDDNDDYILVYKNKELIHKKKINDFNIELENIYYNE